MIIIKIRVNYRKVKGQKLTNIKLHGLLGEAIGSDWNLAVSSVSEAVRAIETLSKRKFYRFLLDNDKKGVKYQVLINKRDFLIDEEPSPESIQRSELAMKINNLESVDIIPVIEGAGGGLGLTIAGALLIVIGVILLFTPLSALGVPVIVVGVGLVAGGVIQLLTSPPKFQDFQALQNSAGGSSYLFSGPTNVTKEGNPVPIGYGRLMVGSQVISASYETTEHDAFDGALTS